mmetsp:Transcript_47559/g.113206  ORF Transcript_47559/g.113206 Transcript_47559/m.113206 type:complete len:273 (-) Transcript_47559:1356-2174(-)
MDRKPIDALVHSEWFTVMCFARFTSTARLKHPALDALSSMQPGSNLQVSSVSSHRSTVMLLPYLSENHCSSASANATSRAGELLFAWITRIVEAEAGAAGCATGVIVYSLFQTWTLALQGSVATIFVSVLSSTIAAFPRKPARAQKSRAELGSRHSEHCPLLVESSRSISSSPVKRPTLFSEIVFAEIAIRREPSLAETIEEENHGQKTSRRNVVDALLKNTWRTPYVSVTSTDCPSCPNDTLRGFENMSPIGMIPIEGTPQRFPMVETVPS